MLCYITGSRGVSRVAEAFAAGIDIVQIRVKDLSGRELFQMADEVSRIKRRGKLLINDRLDIALACGADGLHLPANRPPASTYRSIAPPGFIVSVACHSPEDVQRAAAEGADLALLAPVFSTPGKGPPLGLEAVRLAARAGIPVLALGGVTLENAESCFAAGAAGIAAIRLFEDADDLLSLISRGKFRRVPYP